MGMNDSHVTVGVKQYQKRGLSTLSMRLRDCASRVHTCNRPLHQQTRLSWPAHPYTRRGSFSSGIVCDVHCESARAVSNPRCQAASQQQATVTRNDSSDSEKAVNDNLRTNSAPCWVSGVYVQSERVRDYELDQFNVVNNAVYASYFQHARHEALASVGFDCDASARAGTPLALSELNLTFKAPLKSRQLFDVEVWIEKISAARLTIGQRVIIRSGEMCGAVAAEATAVVVWLDSDYKPTRIPADIRGLMDRLLKQRQAADSQL